MTVGIQNSKAFIYDTNDILGSQVLANWSKSFGQRILDFVSHFCDNCKSYYLEK